VGKEETISDSESTYSLSTFLTSFFVCGFTTVNIPLVTERMAGIQENEYSDLGGNVLW
jgi:hypothetical protein